MSTKCLQMSQMLVGTPTYGTGIVVPNLRGAHEQRYKTCGVKLKDKNMIQYKEECSLQQ